MADYHVHQLLHGYRNGHELLAGSVKLLAADAELVARLSDLSGTLQSDLRFVPYLTIYPLPSGKYYAIARTWLDREAPRSGCVLTRTALVPVSEWETGGVPVRSVLRSLGAPNRHDVVEMREPLLVQEGFDPPGSVEASFSEMEVFVAKYFGEGIRPIVWLREREADELLASVVDVLWPEIRKRFAACTLSLQPRSLANSPFDLLMAPPAAYSRFSKVARENLIDASAITKARPAPERWVKELSDVIFYSKSLPVPADWPDVDQALGSEPTSVRWLYLLNDLRARTSESPTAALGAMDILETLCPEPNTKSGLKSTIAETALRAGDETVDSGQALSFMQLVCERLAHRSYLHVEESILVDMRDRVERRATSSVEQALAVYEELSGRSQAADGPLSAFRDGLVQALASISRYEPQKLVVLHQFDGAAADIVPSYPRIGTAYLGLEPKGEFWPVRDIARWLNNTPRSVDWLEWSIGLSTIGIDHLGDDVLLGEVLSKLTADNAGVYLARVESNLNSNQVVVAAIEKYLAKNHPGPIRTWALKSCATSEAAAQISGSTYDLSAEGISELLSEGNLTVDGRIAIFSEILLRIPQGRPPVWLEDLLQKRSDVIVILANAVSNGNERVTRAFSRVIAGLSLLPPDTIEGISATVHTFSETSILDELCGLLVRSTVAWILRGRLENASFHQLAALKEIQNWIVEVDPARLAQLVSVEIADDKNAYGRAWSFLATAPEPLFRSRRASTITIINQLLRQSHLRWTREVSIAWCSILERAHQLCEPRYYLRHTVQALGFSLSNSQLPLSVVVRSAFPNVYRSVAEQSPHSDEANSLVSYDWDKAKALRRNLVDCFYSSDWPAGDLALSAAESFGLRKLFRRVWRKWYGEEYVTRMLTDLRKRDEPDAFACMNELIALLRNPNFYEDWD